MKMYVIGCIIVGVLWGVFWGVTTKKIIENKGYGENWFWWGFFFGMFAFVVACTKSENKQVEYKPNSVINNSPMPGSWICSKCRAKNARSLSVCKNCGETRY